VFSRYRALAYPYLWTEEHQMLKSHVLYLCNCVCAREREREGECVHVCVVMLVLRSCVCVCVEMVGWSLKIQNKMALL
jgi:hypothetical protein